MHRTIAFILAILAISACSGYLSVNENQGDQAHTLALQGGGYLSEPGFNEISPFLFRDKMGQNPVLFYSSDRDGDYDIYLARMSSDGVFESRQILSNTIENEIFPQVFYSDTNLYLTCLVSNAGSMQFYTWELDPQTLSILAQTQTVEVPIDVGGLGLVHYPDRSNPGTILLFKGTNYLEEYLFNGGWWGVDSASVGSYTFDHPVYSGAIIYDNIFQDEAVFSLMETRQGGTTSLFVDLHATLISQGSDYSNSYAPGPWQSDFKDSHPYVDFFGADTQVYFSSIRGTVDYDLYRYNVQTFKQVVQEYPLENLIALLLSGE